jgi:signal transduction histidine kinase
LNSIETLKIMLVDDRPENLKSLKHLLERPDLEILTADSGNEALGMMLDHDLALVLLDVQMPGMDGFEVAELMRRNTRTKEIPVIFVTAINKERRHIFSGYDAGAVDYIFKPVDPFIIRSKVNVFLEIKRNHLVRQRLVAELNQANNRLQEISDRKSDFLSAASHELRTPLTVIKEFTSLVLEEVVGPLNGEQKNCLGSALRNCNRLADLVNDLLDLDSIESGYSHVKREKVDLAVITGNIQQDFSEKLQESGQVMKVELAPDLAPVLGDQGMLAQVFFNLVGNANKFTPPGGEILVRALNEGQSVRIEVSDNGCGISPDDQARVFEKFTQLNRQDGPGPQGTGLGLSITNKILELHGVGLSLESEEGCGSTFSFSLPAYGVDQHLKTFVADGTTGEGSGNRDWTLIFLKPEEGYQELPIGLEKEVERLFRQGEDRCTDLVVGGQPWHTILLRTGRRGCASFLARLEDRLGRRQGDNSHLTFAMADTPPQVGGDDQTDLCSLEFRRLEFSFEEIEVRSGYE